MSVRAKFTVVEKAQRKSSYSGEVTTVIKLAPVTQGSDENKEFYHYTPSGSIDLGTINPNVVNQFELGKEYYVDFTEAE
jgi:hypothetical protein